MSSRQYRLWGPARAWPSSRGGMVAGLVAVAVCVIVGVTVAVRVAAAGREG